MGKGPIGLGKEELEPERRIFLLSQHHGRVQCSLVPRVGLLSGESAKQAPSTLIPSIILALWGRSVFNRAMLISTASLGRKVTKQRFHFDVIKLALNKYTACSHTRHAADLRPFRNS